jgi:two-component system sensor histidine kinase BaeS
MASLRTRFILSHLLPLLIIIPLMGLLILYVLETQFFLPALSTALARQAELIAALTEETPPLWQNNQQAQAIVDHLETHDVHGVSLLNRSGTVIASGTNAPLQVGDTVTFPFPVAALSADESADVRQTIVQSQESGERQQITVWVPVTGHTLEPLGAVRITQTVNRVTDELLRLRYAIGGVLLVGLVIGGGLGAGLAFQLERPLNRLTQAVQELVQGTRRAPLPVNGARELQQLTGAVNTLTTQLNSVAKTRLNLLANLSHELNRPLGAMQSAVEALGAGATEEPELRQELLEGVAGEIHRLHRLSRSLVDLHAGLSGPFALHREALPLGIWLPTVLAPYRSVAHAKGLAFNTNLSNDLPTLALDPDRMGQLLGNLLDNAIKYTAQGKIEVTAQYDSDKRITTLVVRDTGQGIDPADLPHLFTPFFRSNKYSRFPQGMGLGLTIARDIATAHGGTLTAANHPDGGAVLEVKLVG